jgi:hypothetical protein
LVGVLQDQSPWSFMLHAFKNVILLQVLEVFLTHKLYQRFLVAYYIILWWTVYPINLFLSKFCFFLSLCFLSHLFLGFFCSMALCLYFCTSFCLGFFVFSFSFWFCVSQYYGRIFPLLLVLWQKLSPLVNIWHWPPPHSWETDEVSRNLMVGKSIPYRLLLLKVPEYSHHHPTVIQTTPSILSYGLHTKLLLWRCRFLCNFRDMLRCFLIW